MFKRIETELRNSKSLHVYVSAIQGVYEILSLKYLCDNGTLDYDTIMRIDDLEKLKLEDDKLTFMLSIDYKKYLHEIQYENLKELIIKYVNDNKDKYDDLSFIEGRKLVYINLPIGNISYYDLKGLSTYVSDDYYVLQFYLLYKFFDKVLCLKNEYKKLSEIKLSDYQELHFYSERGRFGSFALNEKKFDKIEDYINSGLRVILYASYNQISNFKNGSGIIKYLKNVIFLSHNKSTLIFEKKEHNGVSIINYQDEIDLDKLKRIIINDRKIKDTLIKVKSEEIYNNNYRLGFRLYQLEYENKNKTINEIVDENTKLIERLELINGIVEKEINYLINK